MSDLLERVVVPLASEDDAGTTARGLRRYLDGDRPRRVVAIHVIEKAGGAPDKASVEQRQERAERIFERFRESLADLDLRVETDVVYGTDVAEAIFEAAGAHDATAIAFTPRGGGWLTRLLTGDVTRHLVTETDRPVVVLPDDASGDPPGGTDSPDETDDPDGPDSPAGPDDSDEERV